ncbi:MAG: hypothetical protein M3Y86_10150, partial [Verrucomicrobiota bacterium]|nr:hypothetical protein [Verrucomicrobiota bacterium]
MGERTKEGVAVHGPWLLGNKITPDRIGALIDTARTAETEFGRARVAKAAAAARAAAVDAELTSWLGKARLVVMLAYGSKWSHSWIAAGFTHRGTNVPKRIKPRLEL